MLLREKLKPYHLLLGSGSPRRRELLAGCGLEFEVVRYDVEECYPTSLQANDVAPYLSELKANGYPDRLSDNDILITADTVVVLDDMVLGKPDGEAGAHVMLRELSGKKHTVVSGVVVRNATKQHSFTATTDVWFRHLTDEEIRWYVSECQPLDKAGAYGIQEWLGYSAVERISGSFYNVMGLPIEQLYVALERFVDDMAVDCHNLRG